MRNWKLKTCLFRPTRKRVMRSFAALSTIVILLAVQLLWPKAAEAAWWNDSWAYRTPITFTNNAADTYKKVKFDIDTASLITAGKMQSDCGDSRFTDAHGKPLKYYIDTTGGACNTASTNYYVLMPVIVNGTNLIYHYYGNPSAPNGTETAQFSQATLTPSGGAATTGTEEKAPSPYVYWKFDEGYGTSAQDSGRAQNNATLAASPATPSWLTKDQCVYGKCLRFDGVDDYASASNVNLSDTNVITVEFWMKWNSYANDDKLAMEFSTNVNTVTDGFMIDPDESTTGKFNINIKSDLGGNSYTIERPTANVWHHYAFVMDKSVGAFAQVLTGAYVDGKSVTIASITSSGATNNFGNEPLYFMSRAGSSLFGKGDLDDVKIYKFAKTAAQVQADYNSAAAVLGSSSQAFLSQGLVGYWKMDESSWTNDCSTSTVTDSSGNGNAGKSCPSSTGPTGGATGKFGNGGSFDGINDYVDLGSASNFPYNADPRTMCVWAKTNSITDNGLQDALSYGKANGGQYFHIGMQGSSLDVGGGYNSTLDFVASNFWTTNTWNHICLSYDGTTMRLYTNGQLQSSRAVSLGTLQTSAFIGQTAFGSGNWNGSVDEARIYNRVLSGSEITQLYNWAPGPVARWDFEEGQGSTVNDTSGNGRSGTWAGSGTTHWAAGKIGKAGSFDGSSDYVSMNDFPLSNTRTFSGWIYATNVPASGNKVIMAKRNGMTGGSGSIPEWHFYLSNGKLAFGIWDGMASTRTATGATTVTPNTWHYIAGTYDGSTLKVYLDGQVDGSTSISTTIMDGDTPYHLGDDGDSQRFFAGKMDQIMIYNYARTARQVIEDMNGGHPAGGSPVGSQVGYWKFEEGYGTTAHNSGNGGAVLSGTLSGSTTPSWTTSGKFGKALSFNGTSAYVNIPSNPSGLQITSDLTLSAWVKLTTNNAAHDIISKDGASGNYGYRLFTDSNGKLNLEISSNGTAVMTATGNKVLATGVWYHVAGVYDPGNSLTIYVNGVQDTQNTTSIPASIFNSTANVNIGAENGGTTNFMSGSIDEPKIYAGQLTADQLKIDMNRGSAQVLGSTGTTASGVNDNSADRAYCPPGDSTGTCGPVGEWNFEEGTGATANDTSGSGKTGTIVGSTWASGAIGKALHFNGTTSDYVSLGNNIFGAPGSFTVEAWIRTSASGAQQAILSEYQGGVCGDALFHIASSGFVAFHDGFFTTNTGNRSVTDGKWHHVVYVYNGSTGLTYVDGIPGSDTTGASWQNSCSSVDVRIGGEVGGAPFNGDIDQLRFYNYARSKAQILWDYNRGGPVAEWKMDECQGSVIHDSSNNRLDGTLTVGGSGTQTSAGSCLTSATAWGNGATGKINSSLNFDGTDDYVRVTNNAILEPTDELTYAAWFYPTSVTGTHIIMAKNDGNISPFHIKQLQTSGTELQFEVYNGSTLFYTTSGANLSPNKWYHAVVTVKDNSSINLYLNGQKVYTAAAGDLLQSDTNDLIIGGGLNSGSVVGFFAGQIDDARVYNYALTSQQVEDLYNGGAVRFGPVTGSP